MSNPLADPGHGHSRAAWSTVLLMLIGLSIATVALFFEAWVVLIVGVIVFVVGPIVGLIMKKAGLGVDSAKHESKAH
ncbi:MAG: HGxxPAAW family protein [Microbacterium sp.]